MSRSPDSKARLRLWLKLLKTTRGIEAELRERLRTEFATTLPRFDVMAALDRAPEGLKMSEISDRLRVSNGNVTGIVDRLVSEGHAVRDPVPGDRRASRIRLTEGGRAAFGRLARAHEGWIETRLGALDAAAVADLSRQLDRITGETAHAD